MIVHGGGYCIPRCDRCGHHLPGKKTYGAARASMVDDGWVSKPHIVEYGVEVWEDICRLCQRKERGNFPWMEQ